MPLTTAIDPGLVREMLALKPGQHLCLIYEDDPLEQMPALLPFISQGLERNEQCVYIADDSTIQQLREALNAYGVDAALHEERGALQLWTRDDWRQPGELDVQRKSAQVRDIIEKALLNEFAGVRFCVEMTWTLGPDLDTKVLRLWEATINSLLSPDLPVRVVCQYSRRRIPAEVVETALSTHPVAIVGGDLYPNPYYNAPSILRQTSEGSGLQQDQPSQVEWMLSQLKWARAYEQERMEHLKTEEALREAESSREQFAELYALAEARGEELRRALAAKDEFLGLVSHELRTPIATVIGNGLLLQKRAAMLQPEDRDQAMDDIVTEGKRLQRIIENLLMLTRTDRPLEPQLEPVSLEHVVNETADMFRRRNPERDLVIALGEETPIALAEPTLITEVLQNLVSNANKYSRPGAPIEVHSGATADGHVIVRVRDRGEGIPEDELERVFETFYRSPAAANKAGGLGLGLAVCKRVVEAMGGCIWAESRTEGGSDFVFTLQSAASSAEY